MKVDQVEHAGARAFVCVDVQRTVKGYTLTLRRADGMFPVLGIDGREPKRWRNLDQAMAFLVENFGVLAAIRLDLRNE